MLKKLYFENDDGRCDKINGERLQDYHTKLSEVAIGKVLDIT